MINFEYIFKCHLDFDRKAVSDLDETSPVVNYWNEDIVKEINTVIISPSQIHKEEQIGRG